MKKRLALILVVAMMLCCLTGCFKEAVGEDSEAESFDEDKMFIAAAKDVVRDSLKKPSTASFNDAEIYEKDDYGRAIVLLDVSAENSLGGWTRDEFYVCITSVDEEGNYTHSRTMDYTTDKQNVLLLKQVNDFGEPK